MGTLLPGADHKEALFRVYVKALPTWAGYSTSVPQSDPDNVDIRLQAGGPRRPAIDLQLKPTSAFAEPQGGFLRFRLPAKNCRSPRHEAQPPIACGVGTCE